ncbi:MAG: bifunctional phosphoribosylaminoimidazolecarboxamide formyltransferase/IMP cyclohydrolase, partial [Acidimicrobiales bacterium]
PAPFEQALSLRGVDGGFLVQETDRLVAGRETWRIVTAAEPSPSQWADLQLAWVVCARTSSNAVVVAKDGVVLGVGAGQQNRLDAARIAAKKSAGRASGGAGASDAFFPFRDGLDALVESGTGAIVQPGGSVHDQEVIEAADELGVAMVFTGERHFRH